MSPAFSQGANGRPYRYYVSTDVQQGRAQTGDLKRVAGPALDDLVLRILSRLTAHEELSWPEAACSIRRVDIFAEALQVSVPVDVRAGLVPTAIRSRLAHGESLVVADDIAIIHVPVRAQIRGGRTWLLGPDGRAAMRAGINRSLVRALKSAHAVMREAGNMIAAKPADLLGAVAPSDAHDRKLCLLVFLAPDIQRAILDGRQPPYLTLTQLTCETLPLAWDEQRRVLGF